MTENFHKFLKIFGIVIHKLPEITSNFQKFLNWTFG